MCSKISQKGLKKDIWSYFTTRLTSAFYQNDHHFFLSGEDVSPGKDGGIVKSTLVDGSGFQSPNDYASVTSKYKYSYCFCL